MTRKSNIKFLKTLKIVSKKNDYDKIDEIISKYEDGSIFNVTTASNLILQLGKRGTANKVATKKLEDIKLRAEIQYVPPTNTTKRSRDERLNIKIDNLGPQVKSVKREVRQAYERRALNGAFSERTNYDVPLDNLTSTCDNSLKVEFLKNDHIKYYLYANIRIEYVLRSEDDDDYRTMFFNMDAERLTSINQISEFAEATKEKFLADLENPKISSNYKFDSITAVTIQTMRKNVEEYHDKSTS